MKTIGFLKMYDSIFDKADDIMRAMDNKEVDKVLSKIDEKGNVTTYKLDKKGNKIGKWNL